MSTPTTTERSSGEPRSSAPRPPAPSVFPGIPTMLEVCIDLYKASSCRGGVELLPAGHAAPRAGARYDERVERRTLRYTCPRVPMDATPPERRAPWRTGVYEVTVVASVVDALRKTRWTTAAEVLRTLRSTDAVVLSRYPSAVGQHPTNQACVLDPNRRHVRAGFWSATSDGALERVPGSAAIDYMMTDSTMTEGAGARVSGVYGATDPQTGLPCYAGPAQLHICGHRHLWRTWCDAAAKRAYTLVVDVPADPADDVRLVMGPSTVDATSPMGFTLRPCWVAYRPTLGRCSVVLDTLERPVLVAEVLLHRDAPAEAHVYALLDDGEPMCVAHGEVGDAGELSIVLMGLHAHAADALVKAAEGQDEGLLERAHAVLRAATVACWQRLQQALSALVARCTAHLREIDWSATQPAPGDTQYLRYALEYAVDQGAERRAGDGEGEPAIARIEHGERVIVDHVAGGTAYVKIPAHPVTLASIPFSALATEVPVVPLGLEWGADVWLQGRGCRVHGFVVGGSGSTLCITSPLVNEVAMVHNPQLVPWSDAAGLAGSHPPTRGSAARRAAGPTWAAVRRLMQPAAEAMGLRCLWVGTRAVCNVSMSRIGDTMGQSRDRAHETAGLVVTISDYNSCTCGALDCDVRRYRAARDGWPEALDRRLSDSMLSWTKEDARPAFPIGSVVLIEPTSPAIDSTGANVSIAGPAVVCGGGRDLTARDVLHVVRLLVAERTAEPCVVYCCILASSASALPDDEGRLILDACQPRGAMQATPKQLEMQAALILEEETRINKENAKRGRKASKKNRQVARAAFWCSVVSSMTRRVTWIERSPGVRAAVEARRALVDELRTLRNLLEKHAPGLSRCPLSGLELKTMVCVEGHYYNEKPLAEWAAEWGDRALPTLSYAPPVKSLHDLIARVVK